MTSPEEHPVLAYLFSLVDSDQSGRNRDVLHSDFSLGTECIEFHDGEDDQWYEVVVRPIDPPYAD